MVRKVGRQCQRRASHGQERGKGGKEGRPLEARKRPHHPKRGLLLSPGTRHPQERLATLLDGRKAGAEVTPTRSAMSSARPSTEPLPSRCPSGLPAAPCGPAAAYPGACERSGCAAAAIRPASVSLAAALRTAALACSPARPPRAAASETRAATETPDRSMARPAQAAWREPPDQAPAPTRRQARPPGPTSTGRRRARTKGPPAPRQRSAALPRQPASPSRARRHWRSTRDWPDRPTVP
jgi:hypothetical protein